MLAHLYMVLVWQEMSFSAFPAPTSHTITRWSKPADSTIVCAVECHSTQPGGEDQGQERVREKERERKRKERDREIQRERERQRERPCRGARGEKAAGQMEVCNPRPDESIDLPSSSLLGNTSSSRDGLHGHLIVVCGGHGLVLPGVGGGGGKARVGETLPRE